MLAKCLRWKRKYWKQEPRSSIIKKDLWLTVRSINNHPVRLWIISRKPRGWKKHSPLRKEAMMRWMIQKFRFFRALLSLVKEKLRESRFNKRQLELEIVFNWWVCNIIQRSMVLFLWVKSLKIKVKLNNPNRWAWAVWALFHSIIRVKFNKLETFFRSLTYQAFLA